MERFVNVVAISMKEAQKLASSGLHHGTVDEANATLREIRKTADYYYAQQYRVFSVRVGEQGGKFVPTDEELCASQGHLEYQPGSGSCYCGKVLYGEQGGTK